MCNVYRVIHQLINSSTVIISQSRSIPRLVSCILGYTGYAHIHERKHYGSSHKSVPRVLVPLIPGREHSGNLQIYSLVLVLGGLGRV